MSRKQQCEQQLHLKCMKCFMSVLCLKKMVKGEKMTAVLYNISVTKRNTESIMSDQPMSGTKRPALWKYLPSRESRAQDRLLPQFYNQSKFCRDIVLFNDSGNKVHRTRPFSSVDCRCQIGRVITG